MSISRGFRAPHMTDLGTLGLTGSGFEVAAPDVAGLDGSVGTTADAAAVSTGRAGRAGRPGDAACSTKARSATASARWRTELTFFVNNIHDNIQKQALILPQGAVGTVARRPADHLAERQRRGVRAGDHRAGAGARQLRQRARSGASSTSREASFTPTRVAPHARSPTCAPTTPTTDLPPNIEGGTPAPRAVASVRCTRPDRRWWVEPYAHFGWKQTHLSSLDLGDRRTGAGRSRASIQAFFRNGARARGWVGAGPDGIVQQRPTTS